MITPALLATLTKLKNNRLLSGEAKSALAPFIGKTFKLLLAFVSDSRTFGNPYDPAYEDGHTLICKLEDEDIEITVLLGCEEKGLIDSLAPDDTFEAKLTVLDFDPLYQRAIFGQLLNPTAVSEEQAELTEELQTSIPKEQESLPKSSVADESPSIDQPDEILLADPKEAPQLPNESGREKPLREAELEIPTPIAPPPPPPPSPSMSKNTPEKDPEVKTCPEGHGLLEPMAGKMICWTCGWPEHKVSSTTSTDSLKSNRLKKDLDWIRKSSSKKVEEKTVKKSDNENKGCLGCRLILGALFLLIGLASCSGERFTGSLVFTTLGLVCYWPMMKKWFREGFNESNS